MRIHLIMPCMRSKLALDVIEDLRNQSHPIDLLTIVDNADSFVMPKKKTPFDIDLIKPGKNMGVNWAWNLMYDTKMEYVGFMGDDYKLSRNLIRILHKALNMQLTKRPIGMATSTIFRDGEMRETHPNDISGRHVSGKGHMGATLIKSSFAKKLPRIPKQFKIFFGDNWLGAHMDRMGYDLVECSASISTKHRVDLKEKLDYNAVIKEERVFWDKWVRGEIKL